MPKTREILVIGGNGFIGQNIINRANDLEWNTTNLSYNNDKTGAADHFIKADISDLTGLQNALTNNSYDYVVNCGGYVDHSSFFNTGFDTIKTHLNGVMNLISCLDKSKIKKFINIGSSDEYGQNKSPQKESFREEPFSAYSFAKSASSHFLQMMYKSEKIPTLTIRLFLVYGPGQEKNRFIPQIISGCLNNDIFDTSSGEQIRNFCFIDDVIDAIFLSMNSDDVNGKIINIGSSHAIKINEAVNIIKNLIGSGQPQFGKVQHRPFENMSLFPDVKLANELLKWEPKIALEEGILKTIKSFQE